MVGRGAGRVPERWTQYSPLGRRLPGTRFIAFKVPLSKHFERQLLPEQRFSPQDLLRELQGRNQELGLIIDLTCTTRYYGQQELPPTLPYCKLLTVGREIPDSKTTRSFQSLVGEFLRENQHNDKLIGVHCTHGLNRTGYLVCRYLIDVEGMEPNTAIELFNESRGHPMERINYIQDLQRRAPKKKPSSAQQQQPGPRAGELGQEEMKQLEQGQKQQNHLEQRQQNHLEQRQKQQNHLEQNYLEQRQKKQRKQQNHLERREQKQQSQLEQNHLEQRQQKKLKRLERRQKKKQQNYLEQRQQNHLEQNSLEQRQQNHLEQTRLEQRQKKQQNQTDLEQRQPCSPAPSPCLVAPSPCLPAPLPEPPRARRRRRSKHKLGHLGSS